MAYNLPDGMTENDIPGWSDDTGFTDFINDLTPNQLFEICDNILEVEYYNENDAFDMIIEFYEEHDKDAAVSEIQDLLNI